MKEHRSYGPEDVILSDTLAAIERSLTPVFVGAVEEYEEGDEYGCRTETYEGKWGLSDFPGSAVEYIEEENITLVRYMIEVEGN